MKSTYSRALVATAVMLCAFVAAPAYAQDGQQGAAHHNADRDAVRAAVLDYVEGFYQGDSTRLVRSVSPQVYKYGYGLGSGEYRGSQMPYAGFMAFARGVREGRNLPPAGAPTDIVLFDVQDQTASAKLTAWWGTDYLLLARQDGRWMITHVLWQALPRT